MGNKYYAMERTGSNADVYIFGDIVPAGWEYSESDVSGHSLAQELETLGDAENITVHINSNGGSVKEGLAIYNALRHSPAKVTTICEGFACSAASVIFMAGGERIMRSASMLMIHDAWVETAGSADELRKQADDLELISATAANAYLDAGLSVTGEELAAMMKAETWITPEEALDMGFATGISRDKASGIAANAQESLFRLVLRGITAGTPEMTKQEDALEEAKKEENPVGADAGRKTIITDGILKAIAAFTGNSAHRRCI